MNSVNISKTINRFKEFFTHHELVQVIIVGGVLAMFRFWKFLLGHTLLFGDNYSLMVPGKLFTSQWLMEGILPLWNPNIFAGISWIGDINQSIFYLSTLLFVAFPGAVALNINVVIHSLLSFVGMYYLAKTLVKSNIACYIAAIIWTFSPQMAGSVNNISTFQSLSWMPLVVLAGLNIQKKWGVFLLALSVTAQLIGGYPQHVLYTVPVALALSAYLERKQIFEKKQWWSWLRKWLLAGIFSIGLSAFVWLPFTEEVALSTRSIQTQVQAAAGSLEFNELAKLILPHLYDNPAAGIKWGPSWNKPPNVMVYFTWFGLFLIGYALTQRKKNALDWIFFSGIMLSIIIAFGDNLPTFHLLQKIPIFGITRGMSTILMIPSLLGALWIATSFDRLKMSSHKLRTLLTMVGVGVVATAILSSLIWTSFDNIWNHIDNTLGNTLSNSTFHTLVRDELIARNILLNLFVNSCAFFLAIMFFWRKWFSLLIVVIFFEMSFNTQQHLIFAPNQVYNEPKNQSVEQLISQTDLTNYRMLTRNYNSPYSDFGAYWDAMTVRSPFSDSYVDGSELQDFAYLRRMRDGLTPNWNMVAQVPVINGYTTLLPLSMHQQFANDQTDASINNLPQIMLDDPQLKNWAVRYYLVDTWFPTYEEVMPDNLIDKQGSWRLYEIEYAKSRFTDENGIDLQINDLKESPNRLSFSYENYLESTSIVIADRYDKNWKAKVNGQIVKIENFGDQRRFPINQGENAIEIWYFPSFFYYGIAISAITSIFILSRVFILKYHV